MKMTKHILVSLVLSSALSFLVWGEDLPISKLIHDHWYGIYVDGRKVGSFHSSFRPPDAAGGKLLQHRSETVWLLLDHDDRIQKEIEESVFFSPEKPWCRVGAVYVSSDGLTKETIREQLDGDTYKVITSSPDGEKVKEISPPNQTLGDFFHIPLHCIRGVDAGHKGQYLVWTITESAEQKASYKFMEIGQTILDDRQVTTAHVRATRSNGIISDYVYEMGTGRLLQASFGVVEYRLGTEEQATDVDSIQGWPIHYHVDIDANLALAKRGPIRRLGLFLPGVAPEDVPESHRTMVRAAEGGIVVEIREETFEFREGSAESEIPESVRPYLEPSKGIQSDHEEIFACSKLIVGDEKSPYNKAVLINNWVQRNIRCESRMRSDALSTLSDRKGDCTEIAGLAVALGRAAGIPAQEVSGLAYCRDLGQRLGYHSWTRFYVDGRWIEMDPTFNQNAVDATHLEIKTSARFRLAGKVIRVIHIEGKKPPSDD
jgi:hypothetical protein